MANYQKLAQDILDAVGGSTNISSVTHCMTRLRFILKDQSIPKKDEINKIKGVVGTNIAGGQFQVIIGNSVSQVYKEVLSLSGLSDGKAELNIDEPKQKQNPIMTAIDFISSSMTPIFPAIIAGGLLKVILVILGPTVFNVLSTTSDTYIIINALGDAPFYFLPILISFTASKKLNCNSFLAVMVSSMLLYPDLITLLGGESPTYLFGIIPVMHGTYSASIIPAMLSTILLKYVEIWVDKITPDWSKNFLKPLIIIMITAPITLCALAPLGLIAGNGLKYIVDVIYGFAPWLAYAVLSALMPFIVMTGMHWALLPATLMALSNPGYDILLMPTMLASNIAQSGATFGYAFRTKDKEEKSLAFPAAISALLAGVTEPALYGVVLPKRKPLIASCVASGIMGLFAGIVGLKGYAFATPCLTAIAQFIGPDSANFIYAIVVLVGSFAISFILSYILSKDNTQTENKDSSFIKPIKGEIIDLSEIKDNTFASGMMGEGYAIIPDEGKVYAPFDGTCQMIFPTKHALGLKSNDGIELLIHVGLDTVSLNGEPFIAHIKDGETFKQGDLLLEFDIQKIRNAGLEIQTPIIVTNPGNFDVLNIEDGIISIGG